MPKIKVEEMDEMYRKEKKYKATRTFQANICLLLMFRDHVLNIKFIFIFPIFHSIKLSSSSHYRTKGKFLLQFPKKGM